MKKNKKKKGRFFVLDGPDGSGKTTQTELLARRLRSIGKKVTVVDFPQYDKTFFGVMVGAYLKGEFGDVFQISPYLSSLLYALDRWNAKSKMEKALSRGDVILANRFTSSNIIHQGAKMKSKRDREEYFVWLDTLEFVELGIPRPDQILFLDVPTKISWKLIAHRNRANHPMGGKRDKHEASRSHLEAAYKVARNFAHETENWSIIACTKGKTLLTPKEVHEKVYAKVRSLL